MSAEMIIGFVLAAIILLRLDRLGKQIRATRNELMKVVSPEAYQHEIEIAKLMEEKGRLRLVDWLIFALAVAAALTVAWRFLNPFGVSI
jgi:hypothetical protein